MRPPEWLAQQRLKIKNPPGIPGGQHCFLLFSRTRAVGRAPRTLPRYNAGNAALVAFALQARSRAAVAAATAGRRSAGAAGIFVRRPRIERPFFFAATYIS